MRLLKALGSNRSDASQSQMEEPRPIGTAKARTQAKKLTIAIVGAAISCLQAILFTLGAVRVLAQNLPPPEDTRHSMLREAMLGLLTDAQASIPETALRQRTSGKWHCYPIGPVTPRFVRAPQWMS